jgi:hypothetical protein
VAGLSLIAGEIGGLAVLGVVGRVGVDEARVEGEIVVAGDDEFAELAVSWLSRPSSLGVLCGI